MTGTGLSWAVLDLKARFPPSDPESTAGSDSKLTSEGGLGHFNDLASDRLRPFVYGLFEMIHIKTR